MSDLKASTIKSMSMERDICLKNIKDIDFSLDLVQKECTSIREDSQENNIQYEADLEAHKNKIKTTAMLVGAATTAETTNDLYNLTKDPFGQPVAKVFAPFLGFQVGLIECQRAIDDVARIQVESLSGFLE